MHLDVVPGDADLLRDVHRRFLEGVFISDRIEKGDEDVKAGPQGLAVLSQPLDHIRTLLWNDHGGLGDDQDHQGGQDDGDDQGFGHAHPPFEFIRREPRV